MVNTMRRHHDKRMGEKMRAHIKIHHTITRWGARPQWSVTSIFIVMGAIKAQAPDAASKEMVQRAAVGLMEQRKHPREVIKTLWTMYGFAQRYGWN
jgi:hypothetical protein